MLLLPHCVLCWQGVPQLIACNRVLVDRLLRCVGRATTRYIVLLFGRCGLTLPLLKATRIRGLSRPSLAQACQHGVR